MFVLFALIALLPSCTSLDSTGRIDSSDTAASADDVLAVPVSAVFMAPDGAPEVVLVTDPDPAALRTRRLPVTVGAIGGGFAEISADDADLKPDATVLLSWPAES